MGLVDSRCPREGREGHGVVFLSKAARPKVRLKMAPSVKEEARFVKHDDVRVGARRDGPAFLVTGPWRTS